MAEETMTKTSESTSDDQQHHYPSVSSEAEAHVKPAEIPNEVKKRTSKGKQHIEIKRIESKMARQVTFSKRRAGLFKKLAKLCTEHGAQAAAITFSEAGKAFSFGHPSEDDVIQRYINPQILENYTIAENNNVQGYENNTCAAGFWWDEPIDNLGLVDLERFKARLEALRNEAGSRLDQISRCSMDQQSFDFGCVDTRITSENWVRLMEQITNKPVGLLGN